jgi:hypothetical protein
MRKERNLLCKTLVVILIILLIGTSIVSSNGRIDEDYEIYTQVLDAEESSEELYRGNYGYAFYAYPGPECTVYFLLDNPEYFEECGVMISGDYLTGGTIDCNGIWYATQYGTGLLYGIDTENDCEMWTIGGGGSGMTELAWDDYTYTLYGISGTGLFEIDPETGEGGYIGDIDVSLSQIEFDNSGTLYGFCFPDNWKMYTIDLNTLEATFVCNLKNITNGYYSIAFDKDTNNLYLLGNNGQYGFCMYVCDAETGECTLIFSSMCGIEMTSFVIPYGGDNQPPVTTISFDPPEPDGLNSWYVSNVNVTLNATDENGVKITYYRINGGPWRIYHSSFVLSEDGDDILIEFYSVDNAGYTEEVKNATVDIDQTKPEIDIYYDIIGGNRWQGWDVILSVTAADLMSGMDRVEFYYNDELQEIINGSGPEYECEIKMLISDFDFNSFIVRGLICNLEINEEFVNFYSIFTFIRLKDWDGPPNMYAFGYDLAGNYGYDEIMDPWTSIDISPGFYLFQNLTLPNNYIGHVGRFFISATFEINQSYHFSL